MLLRILGEVLSPYLEEYQPIFTFDACRAHYGVPVWHAWAEAKLWPLVVPAKLTWLLQALDTHAFAAFKVRVQRLFQDARLDGLDDSDVVKTVIICVVRAIHEVFDGKDWAKAFASNGISNQQRDVSSRVVRQLGGVAPPILIPKNRPTLEQLQACFPKKTRLPIAALFRPLSNPVQQAGASSSSSNVVPPTVWPIAFRTRSRTRSARIEL